jgi:hypothetical protein
MEKSNNNKNYRLSPNITLLYYKSHKNVILPPPSPFWTEPNDQILLVG